MYCLPFIRVLIVMNLFCGAARLRAQNPDSINNLTSIKKRLVLGLGKVRFGLVLGVILETRLD